MSIKRDRLLEQTRKVLTDCGFSVSDPISLRSISFDVIAKRDDNLLVLKVLQNIDALSKEDADQIRVLSDALGANCAVIGTRSSSKKLEEGIVYSRFGIPILSIETLLGFVKEGVPPFIFAAPGGLYVKIDSDLLRELRRQRNISLGTLAEVAGVSRKAIQMYEDGMGAVIDVAMKIEEFFDEPLVLPLNPFEHSDEKGPAIDSVLDPDKLHAEVFKLLETMGYSVLPTARCPFEAITSDEKILLLTGVERYGPNLERKARVVASISKVVEREAFIITDRDAHMKRLKETVLLSRDELAHAEDRGDVLDMIKERSKSGGRS